MSRITELFESQGDGKLSSAADYYRPNPVTEIDELDVDKQELGFTTYKDRVTLDDGAQHLVHSTIVNQHHREHFSDIATSETSAWLTKAGGLNERRQRARAKLGLDSVFVGAPLGLGRMGKFDQQANDQLEITAHMADRFDHDPDHLIVNGISRAAMIGFGVTSLAPHHDTEVIYNDSIVPVLPNRLASKDIPQYRKALRNELLGVLALGGTPPRILTRYHKTLITSPREIFQNLKDLPTIVSGIAGTMAGHMPDDTFGHAWLYEGDVPGDAATYQEILDSKPNYATRIEPGGSHMSCASESCYQAWHDRMTTIRDMLADSPNARYLGATALRNQAAARNPAFGRPDTLGFAA